MIIFRAFIVWATVQCGYALYFFARIFSLKQILPTGSEPGDEKVSIIICARNEAANLEKNLPLILTQQYFNSSGEPCYEVIVVDDCSTDTTPEVLQRLKEQYTHLRSITISALDTRTLKGKKHALSIGVANTSNEWLLLTDADCSPASDQWLRLMAAPLAQGKKIVAGHGAYNKAQGLLNAFIRWETTHSFLQMSTYAIAGKPYMAVGRNIACTKTILQKAQLTDIWNLSPSGDDDLLVNTFGTPANYALVSNTAAFTYTDAEHNFSDWVKQKQRHLTDGKSYRTDIKALLATYGITHAAAWLYFIVLLFTNYRESAVYIMAIRCIIYWVIWARAAYRLKEKDIIYLLPLFDIGYMMYIFAFLPYILLKNKQHWK